MLSMQIILVPITTFKNLVKQLIMNAGDTILVNVTKVANFYGIVLFPGVCCFLRCTLSL